jgi:hypothetical protein
LVCFDFVLNLLSFGISLRALPESMLLSIHREMYPNGSMRFFKKSIQFFPRLVPLVSVWIKGLDLFHLCYRLVVFDRNFRSFHVPIESKHLWWLEALHYLTHCSLIDTHISDLVYICLIFNY